MNEPKIENEIECIATDILHFEDRCIFARALHEHYKTLFETAKKSDEFRQRRYASRFFDDLRILLIENIILSVCNLTDPEQTYLNKEKKALKNLTILFLIKALHLQEDAIVKNNLHKIQHLRSKLLVSRNKYIAHFDRETFLQNRILGQTTKEEWTGFWEALDEIVSLCHQKLLHEPFIISEVAMLSDADGLIHALRLADCMDIVPRSEPELIKACNDILRE